MKKIFIIILIFLPILLFSSKLNKIVMVKIISKSKISKNNIDMLNSSLEMNLTKLDYGIISQDIQEEALKEQQEQQKSDCYDDGCLVDTGRMLAATELLILNIKKRKKDYFIKARRIDIESGVVKKSDITIIKKNYNEEVAHNKISEMINILFNENYNPKSSNTNTNNLLIKDDDITSLSIKTEPSDIMIILNGRKIGNSPLNENILKGKLKLEIRKEFYKTIKRVINTAKKSDYFFKLKLKPNYTFLNIDTDKDTIIKVNGKFYNRNNENIFKKRKYKIEIEIKDEEKKKYYKKINKTIDISKRADFAYSLELKPKYSYLSINIDNSESGDFLEDIIVKLDEEIIPWSEINNKLIVTKATHKLEIKKEFYKIIKDKIDTNIKEVFIYKLIPIKHIKEIVSSGENVEVSESTKQGIKNHVTPFKIYVTVNNPRTFKFEKDGYQSQDIRVTAKDKVKNIINVKKLVMYKLKINNEAGLTELFIRGEGKNGKIKIKLSEKINKLKLYEGEYYIRGEKRFYKDYYKNIYVEKNGIYHDVPSSQCCEDDVKVFLGNNLKISPIREYDYYFDFPISLISEFNYSESAGKNTSIGLGIALLNQRKRDDRTIPLSVGILGDFYNKSITVNLSLFKWMFYDKGPIFVQIGVYGLGDELSFLFKNDKVFLNGLFSFKIGGDIYLSYPYIKMKVYLKIASLTDTSIKRDEDEDDYLVDDVTFSTGISFVWGSKGK